MKLHDVEQNSLEWLMARNGIPTASEWDALVTPKFEVRTGEMPKTYLAQKVAEKWLGSPLPGFNTLDMDFGKILEEEARPRLAWELETEIQKVGFITTDDGRLGCSPDGLIRADGGCEIKCPEAKIHARYLLAGTVPPDYAVQIQGSMFVTGRSFWYFFSYRRRFPCVILKVERDQKAQDALKTALDAFLATFDASMKRIEQINGGPAKRPQERFQTPTQQPDDQGIIP